MNSQFAVVAMDNGDWVVFDHTNCAIARVASQEAAHHLVTLLTGPAIEHGTQAPMTIPPPIRLALTVLLNHIEPGWENCRALVGAWMDSCVEPK